jgi:hypothetical protein
VPFKSVKQRKFMWAKHPEIAKRWTAEHGSTIKPKAKPKAKAKKKRKK